MIDMLPAQKWRAELWKRRKEDKTPPTTTSPLTMSNQSPEWQAMTKLVGQFYAKADAGELILFVEWCKSLWSAEGRYPTQKMASLLSDLFGGVEEVRRRFARR